MSAWKSLRLTFPFDETQLRFRMTLGTHRGIGFTVDRLFFALKTHFFGKKVRAS